MSRFSPGLAPQFRPPATTVSPPAGIAVPVLPTPPQPNFFQLIGCFTLCIYVFSLVGYVNEMSIRQFGAKPYLTMILGPVAAISCVISSKILKGFRSPVGLLWMAFFVLLVLGAPFSYWRTDSLRLVANYGPRVHFVFFYLCAVCVSVKLCRVFIYMNILGGVLVLFYCIFGGMTEGPGVFDGRFVIPHSSLGNPNDLGLHLLISAAFFFYLPLQKNPGSKLLGIAAIFLAFVFILKTGSRGTFVSIVVVSATVFVVGSRVVKTQFLVVAALAAIMAAAFIPRHTLRRLVLFATAASDIQEAQEYGGSIGSQVARTELLKKSVKYAFLNPLLGLGVGQFANVAGDEATRQGRHIPWAGTHNAYTQVASECGLPALFCYCAVLYLSIRLNYRLLKASRGKPGLEQLHGMSFCLLLVTVAYAVNTFFDHVAYNYYLPVFAGLSVALHSTAQPYLASFRASASSPYPSFAQAQR